MMRLIGEALRDLRVHPGRSVLTAVGLFVAVLSIVAIYTVGAVVRGVFIAGAEQLDGRAVTMQTRLPLAALTPERLDDVRKLLERRVTEAGGAYALTFEAPGRVSAPGARERGEAATGQPVILVSGGLDRVRRLPVLNGQWFGDGARIFPGGLVLNQAAAAAYGGVGTRLDVDLGERVRPYPQQVIGVVADGRPRPQVYQAMSSALSYQPALLSTSDRPQLFVHHPRAGESQLRDLIRSIGSQLGIDQATLEILRADTVGGLLDNLEVTQAAFLAVAAVTLLVAVLGLLNIGLSTVRERGRELTIRRALGSTRGRVFGLVLSGSVLLGLLTALTAIALAYLTVVLAVPHLLDPASALDPPSFPWSAAFAGLLAALLAGLAGGAAPALAASRLDLAHVLRD